MFFDTLSRVRKGVVVCVFDAPDRIQHMFWRFQEAGHPALAAVNQPLDAHRHTIPKMYARMDELVGRTMAELDDGTALFVMSDHGFKSFRRGVDLNAWLRDRGYLFLNDDLPTTERPYLADVDWSRTRAYAIGLAGIFVNQKGREAEGIVSERERRQLVSELSDQLTGLLDVDRDEPAIHQAMPRESVYHGPYMTAAPDIILGYNAGYRVAWNAAAGKCGSEVFSDNTRAWSGDHCIHPDLVPGVLFSNLKVRDAPVNIVDIAPTTLELLGVERPSYMDGHSILCNDVTSSDT